MRRIMTGKAKSNISIIGGADGLTSVWIAGGSGGKDIRELMAILSSD